MDEKTENKATGFSYGAALLIAVAFLTGLGLLGIYAASSIKGAEQFGDPFFFFRKQAVVAIVGFSFIFAFKFVPFSWVKKSTIPILLLSIGLLALIMVPGLYIKIAGASRWLRIGGVNFQPAELAKISLVLFLAANLSRPSCYIDKFFSGILPNLLVFGVIAGLLLLQPDFGSIVLLFAVTFLMLFTAGVTRRFLVATFSIALSAFVALVLFEPYRLRRVLSFLDPWAEIKKGGFQIIQSYLGFQNGGLWGVGLGESQQKRFFLPEAHTDFILSVIGEELGLMGVLLVIFLFASIAYIGFKIATLQVQPYKKFLAFGITVLITVQATINMGVAMGLLPTKGIPLPFVSSGASSLTVFLVAVAILARLGYEVSLDRDSKHERV